MSNTHFQPSPRLLMAQISAAEARFEAAREQASLRAEAEAERRAARAHEAEVKARYYARIQHGIA